MSIDNPGKELKANMTANAEIVLEEHPELAHRARGGDHLRRAEATRSSTCVDPAREDRPPASVPVKLGVGNGTKIADARRAQGRATRSSCRLASQAAAAMREAIVQSIENLRANKLRSFLTMFGILWGVISVVMLSATGEGFQRGNEHVLEELGKNIGIVWGGRTSMQAGGERAGRQIFLTARRRPGASPPSRRWSPWSAPRSSAAASR